MDKSKVARFLAHHVVYLVRHPWVINTLFQHRHRESEHGISCVASTTCIHNIHTIHKKTCDN